MASLRSSTKDSAARLERREEEPRTLFVFLVWMVLLLALFRELTLQSTLLFIGGFNLTVSDPIVFIGGVILAMHAKRRPSLTLGTVLVAAYAAVIALNIARGLSVRPYDAIVTLRLNGGFVVLLLLGLYVRADEWWHPRILRALLTVGGALAALIVLRTALGPTFPFGASADIAVDEINDGGRALSAQGTILVVMAAVVLLARYMAPTSAGGGRPINFMISVFLCLTVVATRQGMATIICVVAWGTTFCAMPGPSRRARTTLGLAAGAAGLFAYYVLPEIIPLEALNDSLPKAFAFDLSKRETTLSFRQAIWAGLLDDRETWTTMSQILGLPAGVKPSIWIDYWGGTLWELSVHSMYYGLLPVAGVVGLALYCGVLASAAVARLKDVIAGRGMPGATLAFTFIIMAALMGISNDLRHENGLLIASALAGFASQRRGAGARNATMTSFEPRGRAERQPARNPPALGVR